MTSESKTWENLKAEYLRGVEKALSSVNHPRSKDILDDVCSHLEQRFSELSPEQQTWENFQAIITDMGPPSDYAEFLNTAQKPKTEKLSLRFVVIAAVVFASIAAVIVILPLVCQPDQRAFELQEPASGTLPHAFVNDPQILGHWQSIDFVQYVNDFQPGTVRSRAELFLKELSFMPNGRTSKSWTWTNGWIYHSDGKTKAEYKTKKLAEATYLFFPWLSGDVTIRGQKPHYYVLKKVSSIEQQKPGK